MSEYRLRSSNRLYFFPKGNTLFIYFNLTSSNDSYLLLFHTFQEIP